MAFGDFKAVDDGSATSGTTVTCTPTIAVGDFVVACAGSSDANEFGSTGAIADDDQTYTDIFEHQSSGDTNSNLIMLGAIALSANPTITWTADEAISGHLSYLIATVYDAGGGIDNIATPHAEGTSTSNNGAGDKSTTCTPTSDGTLIVGCTEVENTGNIVAETGSFAEHIHTAAATIGIFDLVQATAAEISMVIDVSGSTGHVGVIASFLEASGGGPVIFPQFLVPRRVLVLPY